MLLTEFLSFSFSGFAALLTVFFTLAVAFVNGWTDAPNAIASCVVTRSLSLQKAVIMAAVCDFAGAMIIGVFNSKVIMTVANLADFSMNGMPALCAAMTCVVIWATAAWAFGIPTSESHALLAGIMGAGVAVNGNFTGINSAELMKVVSGLILSTLLGFASGFIMSKLTVLIFEKSEKSKCDVMFRRSQIVSGALMAFMHGAQDSQKFAGILSVAVSASGFEFQNSKINRFMILASSAAIALGTVTGGARIIKAVGMDMIKLRRDQGFSADMAGALCLLISTVLGLPVSTTHTKTSAVLGVGASKSIKSVNWSVACEMAAAWILTFPACALMSFIITKIYMRVL